MTNKMTYVTVTNKMQVLLNKPTSCYMAPLKKQGPKRQRNVACGNVTYLPPPSQVYYTARTVQLQLHLPPPPSLPPWFWLLLLLWLAINAYLVYDHFTNNKNKNKNKNKN